MATETPTALRNQILYCIFVRNYGKEGTFKEVENDLERIQALGVDIIWLMPIHPIGKTNRKGTLGSPYAIADYRAVNPEFGTMNDFIRLTEAIHAHGMKCIIDVVYNHTSPDSVLVKEHPEWFYRKADGSFGNKVGEWSDVIDLDYTKKELWDYQIETLKMWAAFIDGFRCDVAPAIPLEFWLQARKEVEKVRPGCIWLAESVTPDFIMNCRRLGCTALTDSELYQAFDICYDYDIYDDWLAYLKGENTLENYLQAMQKQEYTYPENYVKLRFLENHDRPRAAALIPDRRRLWNWTAFLYFAKGMTQLYNGQEVMLSHHPTLFDKDTLQWESDKNTLQRERNKDAPQPENDCRFSDDLSVFLQSLTVIRKDPRLTDSVFTVKPLPHDVICACHDSKSGSLIGFFPVGEYSGHPIFCNLPDGQYVDLISGKKQEIYEHFLKNPGIPVIFEL